MLSPAKQAALKFKNRASHAVNLEPETKHARPPQPTVSNLELHACRQVIKSSGPQKPQGLANGDGNGT
jgi:hypothetical protein